MANKRAPLGLLLGGVLAAAGGVTVNRVGGSVRQQVVVFVVACAFLIAAGAITRWGGDRPGLRLRAADAEGRPPQLGEVELGELGVHWSLVSSDGYGPYVERDADRQLDEAIRSGQTLVAVSGAVLAGRTRTLAEAARRQLADSWLVWFDTPPDTRLTDMLSQARELAHGGPMLLWIENADLALLSQLSARLIDELPPGFRILMTLERNLLDRSVLPGEAAEILNTPGVCIQLGLLTHEERERLAAESAYAQIAAAHKDEPVLMGRLMVSFDTIIDTIETPDEDAVSQVALLHVAVDWQRAAVPKALTREVMEKLYRDGYWQQLASRDAGATASRSRFRQAIGQLLAPRPRHGLPLLDEVYAGKVTHLRPHPLLPVVADSPQRPPGWVISKNLWNYLNQILNNDQRLGVGLTAASRGDYRHARQLLQSLDVADIPAQVISDIAIDAHNSGASTEARRWYQKAIATGHPDAAPTATNNLGVLEEELGRTDDSRGWYEKAIATGHPDAAPKAMNNLGTLELRQGSIDEARGWYEKATVTGHPDAAPTAMNNLGDLEENLGHTNKARGWYGRAIATGHPYAVSRAMTSLGTLELKQGRINKARGWYETAIATGHPEAAPAAMYNLGNLENGQGRIGKARGWYEKAIATGHPDAAPTAMTNLGVLDRELGRTDEARGWYEKAIATGHPEAAPKAMANLGKLKKEQRRINEARGWYEKAIATGHPEAAPKAMFNLGNLEKEQGRINEARGWYERAMATGYPEVSSRARQQLDSLRRHQEDLLRAKNFTKYGSAYIGTDHRQEPAETNSTPEGPKGETS